MLLHLLLLIVACIVLVRSATAVLQCLEEIAVFLKLKKFWAAAVLIALATSLPEIFIGIASALEKTPTLCLGNVLGSNLANLTLIPGVLVLIKGGFNIRNLVVRKDVLWMTLFVIAPLVLARDKVISSSDGLVLLAFYSLYIVNLLRQGLIPKTRYQRLTPGRARGGLLWLILSLALLFLAAVSVVRASKGLAFAFNVPAALIGMFLVALGTILPELALGLKTINIKARNGMLIFGDLVGNVVTNSSLVLGITALVSPIKIPSFSLYIPPVIFLLGALGAFESFVLSDKKLETWEGLSLLFLYILLLVTELSLGLTRA